jgi:hypothetical protein
VKHPLSCQFNQTRIVSSFEKSSKFHENPPSGSRADRHTWRRYRSFGEILRTRLKQETYAVRNSSDTFAQSLEYERPYKGNTCAWNVKFNLPQFLFEVFTSINTWRVRPKKQADTHWGLHLILSSPLQSVQTMFRAISTRICDYSPAYN